MGGDRAILVETIRRFTEPAPVAGTTMIVVAALGIAVNALSALLFAKGSKSDLNLRAAFVHLMADAAVSAGVVIAGIVIMFTGWQVVDPIASLVITAVIAWSSWGLLRRSLRMGMMGVPETSTSPPSASSWPRCRASPACTTFTSGR